MRRHLPARLAAISAMVVAGSLGSIGFVAGGVAGASAPTVTCTTGKITVSGSGTLSGCGDTKNTGGSGKLVASLGKKTGVITWNKTGTTTFKFTYVIEAKDTVCSPKTDKEIKETATTTGGTGAAVKSIPKGQVATTTICEKGSTVTLAPGSHYQI
jgi:hypothetical protein